MSTYNSPDEYNCECSPNQGCEFEFPIHLNVPLIVRPTVKIQSVAPAREILNVNLEPNIQLKTAVGATQPTCLPKNGYHKRELPAAEEPKILP